MKVYEAIADALVAEGCDNLFGLMGDGNMWLWAALAKRQAKIISARAMRPRRYRWPTAIPGPPARSASRW